MRIAVVGSGISGLTVAYLLSRKYHVTLYESQPQLGGHTATKTVASAGVEYAVDTGFIVFNDWTYPNFIRLLEQLGVTTQPTDMGFSAFVSDGSFEYAGNNLNTLFSERRLLLSRSHWRMLKDILRFNREAVKHWRSGQLDDFISLGEYLDRNGYGDTFCNRYLIPMAAAIWSASTGEALDLPARFFVQFFYNHGLLNITNRPTWRVVTGGSANYIAPLTKPFASGIRLRDPVLAVQPGADSVTLQAASGTETFDHVVLACHSDQALALLGAYASSTERGVLGAIAYRTNEVVLHTDVSLLPGRRRTWASWNYLLREQQDSPPVLTYNMNILQGLQSDTTFCVTLNATEQIAPECILGRYQYAHPLFNTAAMAAQQQYASINGARRVWFCGAYWFNGFHEDGVNSALAVARGLGVTEL